MVLFIGWGSAKKWQKVDRSKKKEAQQTNIIICSLPSCRQNVWINSISSPFNHCLASLPSSSIDQKNQYIAIIARSHFRLTISCLKKRWMYDGTCCFLFFTLWRSLFWLRHDACMHLYIHTNCHQDNLSAAECENVDFIRRRRGKWKINELLSHRLHTWWIQKSKYLLEDDWRFIRSTFSF